MENAKGCFRSAGLIWLALVVLVGLAGAWMTRNVDTVAEAAAEASGLKDAVARDQAARCERAKREAQRVWDAAVESGRFDESRDRIDETEAEAKLLCAGA